MKPQKVVREESEATNKLSNGSATFVISKKARWRLYLDALRPYSFSASLSPVLLGAALAHRAGYQCNVAVLFLTTLTILCLHSAGNLVNTYYDYVNCVDNKKSQDRTLVDHILKPNEVIQLGAGSYLLGTIGIFLLVIYSPAKVEHLALLFFGGLSFSFHYTGGIGFKYLALGDLVILITFGPLAVLLSYLTQTGTLSCSPLFYAVPLALNTEVILHANNTRDMETDRQAGIKTLAILLGPTGSYCLLCVLLFLPYMMLVVAAVRCSFSFMLPFITIQQAFKIEKSMRHRHLDFIVEHAAKLNLVFGCLYTVACWYNRGKE